MADEFAKGFAVLTGAGLIWMVLSGWYNTPGFEKTQLLAAAPSGLAVYGQLALTLRDVMFWFAVFGALAFWVVVPAIREAREALA